MSPLPLPVRVAVGLAVTAVEQVRKLPEQLAELPVTAASRAVQAAMRMQQRVTELAIKGDEVFSLFRRVEDSPPWARFDEDDEPDPPATTRTQGTAAARGFDDFGEVTEEPLAAVFPGPGTWRGSAIEDLGEVDEVDVARAVTSQPTTSQPTTSQPTTSQRPVEDDAQDTGNTGNTGDTGNGGAVRSGVDTPALPGYDDMSLPQLRGKLRELSLYQLAELLEYEHTHQDRAPYVTLLSNRITTVRSQ